MPFKDKDKQDAYFKQYNQRDYVKEKDRIRNAERKDYLKEIGKKRWEEKKEELKEYKKRYNLKNKDIIKERRKEYYQQNKEVIKERVSNYRKENPYKIREAQLKCKFGIDLDEYTDLLIKQDNKCAICKSDDTGRIDHKYFHVDHDHKTGNVRGLLCSKCNSAIGLLNDDVGILKNAINYLNKINV